MKLSKTTWWMIGGAGTAFLSIGTFLYFNKKVTQTQKSSAGFSSKPIVLGTTQGANTLQVPNWSACFDMNYTKEVQQWLSPKSILILDIQTAKEYAKIIKNAKGTFNDNEGAVRVIFSKRIRDKTQVSEMSKAFWRLYKIDMWQYLKSFLSQRELAENVTQFIRQIPNYTLA